MAEKQLIKLQDYQVPNFVIDKVDLEFNLGDAFTIVRSKLKINPHPQRQGDITDLVLMGDKGLTLESISLDGKDLTADRYLLADDKLTILNVPASAFDLQIETKIKPQENTALTGLYQSSGNFCTQCEAEGFRRITYYLDRPDVMSRFTTKITADKKKYPILLSNGNLVASGDLDDGRHWVVWEDPFKKPSYLFALVAGNFEYLADEFITQSGRKVALRLYVEKGNKDKSHHAMQGLKKAMRWDEEVFGREYDLDIYMIVAVSDFNMGAMENKGLNVFNTKYILAKPETATDEDFIHVEAVIAHEYFHNWSGNRVTCRDWFQLSLKEGLTIFRDQSFTEDTTSKTVARIHNVNTLRTQQFSEDAGPFAHPVRPDAYMEINNFYTSTIYNKGAEVIRMMKTIIGKEHFRQGMDLYFQTNDGKAVTIEEFVAAMEEASGYNLAQFRLWYSQAGTPQLHVVDHYDADTKTYTLIIEQTCPPTPGQPNKLPFHIPVKMGLISKDGQALSIPTDLLEVKKAAEEFVFHNIAQKPIPSLLRGFSAPVKVFYEYSDQDLKTLFLYDADPFNRWEAGQQYAVNVLLRLVHEYQTGNELDVPTEYIEAFRTVLQDEQLDKWLLAEMLTLPSEKYIGEQMQVVDVDAIHTAREFLLFTIAKECENVFYKLYQHNSSGLTVDYDVNAVGPRQLKNLSLYYLMMLPNAKLLEDYGMRQFKESLGKNMTDTIAALRSLIHVNSPFRDQALETFYEKWHDDQLVVDKWFSLQAISKLPDTLSKVKALTKHPAFDLHNPNKVYALIGGFCHHNPVNFHALTGEGYAFLADIVSQLDKLNPQIAARMVQPLINWNRFDKKRQQLMKAELDKLSRLQLSPDVFELVTKSLNYIETV